MQFKLTATLLSTRSPFHFNFCSLIHVPARPSVKSMFNKNSLCKFSFFLISHFYRKSEPNKARHQHHRLRREATRQITQLKGFGSCMCSIISDDTSKFSRFSPDEVLTSLLSCKLFSIPEIFKGKEQERKGANTRRRMKFIISGTCSAWKIKRTFRNLVPSGCSKSECLSSTKDPKLFGF